MWVTSVSFMLETRHENLKLYERSGGQYLVLSSNNKSIVVDLDRLLDHDKKLMSVAVISNTNWIWSISMLWQNFCTFSDVILYMELQIFTFELYFIVKNLNAHIPVIFSYIKTIKLFGPSVLWSLAITIEENLKPMICLCKVSTIPRVTSLSLMINHLE